MGVRPTWARTLTPVIAAKAALTRRNLSSVSRKARPTGLLTTRSSTSARRRHPLAASTPRRTAASHLVTTPPDARLTARTPLPFAAVSSVVLVGGLPADSALYSRLVFIRPPIVVGPAHENRLTRRRGGARLPRGVPLAFARAVVW